MTPMASIDYGAGSPTVKAKSKVAKKRLTIEAKHRQNVADKNEKVETLKALEAEWAPFEDQNPEYVTDIRRRLRIAEAQLRVMRP